MRSKGGSHEARRMIDAARTAVGRLASLLQLKPESFVQRAGIARYGSLSRKRGRTASEACLASQPHTPPLSSELGAVPSPSERHDGSPWLLCAPNAVQRKQKISVRTTRPNPVFQTPDLLACSVVHDRDTCPVYRIGMPQHKSGGAGYFLQDAACLRLRTGSVMLLTMAGGRSCSRGTRAKKWLRGVVRAGETILLCAMFLWLGGVRDAGQNFDGLPGKPGTLSAGTCPGDDSSLSGCVQRPARYAVLTGGREWAPPVIQSCPRWLGGRDRWARLQILSSVRTTHAGLMRCGGYDAGHCDRQAVAHSKQLLC